MEIVGYVRDASYDSLREPFHPTVYVPRGEESQGTFIVRTTGDPLQLAPILRARRSPKPVPIFMSVFLTRRTLSSGGN